MKKNVLIIIFILLVVLGITSSYAWKRYEWVYSTPKYIDFENGKVQNVKDSNGKIITAKKMLEYLKNGVNLTGISAKVRDAHESLLCNESFYYLYPEGRYELAGNEEKYPEKDEKNG